MLDEMKHRQRTRHDDGAAGSSRRVGRRRMLSWGAASAMAALWGPWARTASADSARAARAKSVILIFNCGAPSHIDLWDMKPNAPDSIRGEFRPISTRVPGMLVSELMPHVAEVMDKLTVIRTLHHEHAQHNAGMYWSIVGRPYSVDSTLINPSPTDFPSFGTLVGWLAHQSGYRGAIPPYVITPRPHCDSFQYITPGQYGGCLGASFDPWVLNRDPNEPNFRVPGLKLEPGLSVGRLQERRELLQRLEQTGTPIALPGATELDMQRDKAFAMVASPEVSEAFDLSREPASVRDRYGRHSWGQSHLLARRLIEAGSRMVTTVNGPSITWDTHINNFSRMRNELVPPMEQAFAALIEDLDERGLLDETIVVWLGDFGRTPQINAQAGRDHWPQCFTAVIAGGGVPGGQYVGQSDQLGAYPVSRPVTPADLHATVFRLLGYDPATISYRSADGRPIPVSTGTPITELL
ncbi:MAG: DUF1501 domain-containing protein [Pirellulales bacterium]